MLHDDSSCTTAINRADCRFQSDRPRRLYPFAFLKRSRRIDHLTRPLVSENLADGSATGTIRRIAGRRRQILWLLPDCRTKPPGHQNPNCLRMRGQL